MEVYLDRIGPVENLDGSAGSLAKYRASNGRTTVVFYVPVALDQLSMAWDDEALEAIYDEASAALEAREKILSRLAGSAN